jgi:RNA polymerase sigma-70 factor, ECF subfamily
MFITKNDEKLIEQALNGSQSSWVKLVKRYEALVYNYCLRMTFNSHDAMDLMQEVFLAVYRNLPSYRAGGKFKGWMMRIAANKTTDFIRAKFRNPLHHSSEILDDDFIGKNSPDSDYEIRTSNKKIMQVLATLSDDQRQVVELKFFQHFTFEEISQQTGVAVSTIKTRLYAALQKLKGNQEIQNAL